MKLSEHASAFMAATLDLLEAVEHADPALITDDVLEKAQRLLEVIASGRGNL